MFRAFSSSLDGKDKPKFVGCAFEYNQPVEIPKLIGSHLVQLPTDAYHLDREN